MTPAAGLRCLGGVTRREIQRAWGQRARLIAAFVRPLLWLAIFAAGFRSMVGLQLVPPTQEVVAFEVYLGPGLIAMIQLFNGMQSSLAMVYDRELGSMKAFLIAPFPRWYLLLCRLVAGTGISILQVYAFLVVARFWGLAPPPWGYLTLLPALMLAGLVFGALGMALAVALPRIENFAGVMNFVVFPVFFASSALYPLAQVRDSSPLLYEICRLNPFTHAVEMSRFALYGHFNAPAALVLICAFGLFFLIAVKGHDPDRGLLSPPRRTRD